MPRIWSIAILITSTVLINSCIDRRWTSLQRFCTILITINIDHRWTCVAPVSLPSPNLKTSPFRPDGLVILAELWLTAAYFSRWQHTTFGNHWHLCSGWFWGQSIWWSTKIVLPLFLRQQLLLHLLVEIAVCYDNVDGFWSIAVLIAVQRHVNDLHNIDYNQYWSPLNVRGSQKTRCAANGLLRQRFVRTILMTVNIDHHWTSR